MQHAKLIILLALLLLQLMDVEHLKQLSVVTQWQLIAQKKSGISTVSGMVLIV